MFRERRAQTATEFAVIGSLIIIAFAFLISYSEKINRQQYYLQQTFRLALKEARKADNSASYTQVIFNRMPNVSRPMELGQLQSFSHSSSVLWQDGKNSRDNDGRDKLGVVKYQLNDEEVNVPQHETLNNLMIDLLQYSDPQNTITPIISDLNKIETALRESNPDYQEQQKNLIASIYALTAIGGIENRIISGLQAIADSFPVGTMPPSMNTFMNTIEAQADFEKRELPPGAITTTRKLTVTDIFKANVKIGDTQLPFTHYLGEGGKYYRGNKRTLERSRSMQ